MDIKQTVINYYRASNPVVFFVSEEVFQVQTGVEQAVIELNAGREKGDEVRLILHDPLVGFHFGEFKIDGTCGVRPSLVDLVRLISPDPSDEEHNIELGGEWRSLTPEQDCIAVFKGWESLLRKEEPESPDFVQALSNIFQGNLCELQWAKIPEELDVSDVDLPPRLIDVDARKFVVRGKRMLVFISKNDTLPAELNEIRPIYVPLPGPEQFESIVEIQWADVAGRGDDLIKGIDDPLKFKQKVVSALTGFPLSAGEDAFMLSLIENSGFDVNGTLDTIERLKAASIARVPGLKYVPQAKIDKDSVLLPGFGPVEEFCKESTDMDPEFAKSHNIRPLSGLIIVGPPGTGKSIVSNQVARLLGKPQIVWSMGESQGSLVSESETNTRRVIDTANVLNAVLTLDDADKSGLSTDRLANDGGVFDRMINILLTEMADPDCNITWIITGNRIQNIRPELYRDGRVDERFFVDIPDAPLRADILRYHIRKYNYPDNKFAGLSKGASAEALADLASDGIVSKRRTGGWTGTELAGLVQRAVRREAKLKGDELDIEFMLDIATKKTPQSRQKAAKTDYDNMRDMCSDFVRVGVSDAGSSLQAAGATSSRRRADIPK